MRTLHPAACFAACVLLTPPLIPQATVGPNVRVNQAPGGAPQVETIVVSNRTNPANLVAVFKDYRVTGWQLPGYAWSMDGGGTWIDGILPSQSWMGTTFTRGSDPWLVAAPGGEIYYSHMQYDPGYGGAWVAKTVDGGQSWTFGPPAIPPDALIDKPSLAIDDTQSAFAGSLYVFAVRVPGFTVRFARSTDGAVSWSPPIQISDAGGVEGPVGAVGPAGQLYASWQSWLPSSGWMYFDRSFDGGATWGPDAQIAFLPAIWTSPGFGGWPILPRIACDASQGPFSGRIYIVWSDRRNGDTDVFLVTSSDQGASFTPPLRVNDDPLGNGTDQFFANVAVEPGGAVVISYADRREDPANHLYHVRLARSFDGGATFEPSVRVTTVPTDPASWTTGVNNEYTGLDPQNGRVNLTWTDSRLGEADIFHAQAVLDFVPDATTFSAASGGTRSFLLAPGPNHAGRPYVVAASASGSSPGTMVGSALVPLNADPLTWALLSLVNTPSLPGFAGALGPHGRASAGLAVPPGTLASTLGLTFTFAYVLGPTPFYASNPTDITVVP